MMEACFSGASLGSILWRGRMGLRNGLHGHLFWPLLPRQQHYGLCLHPVSSFPPLPEQKNLSWHRCGFALLDWEGFISGWARCCSHVHHSAGCCAQGKPCAAPGGAGTRVWDLPKLFPQWHYVSTVRPFAAGSFHFQNFPFRQTEVVGIEAGPVSFWSTNCFPRCFEWF